MKPNLTMLEKNTTEKINNKLGKDIPISAVFRNNKTHEEVNFILRTYKTRKIFEIFKSYEIEQLKPGSGDIFANLIMSAEGYETALIFLACLLFGLLPAIAAFFEGNFINDSLMVVEINPSTNMVVGALHDTIHDIGYWNQYAVSLPIVTLIMSMYFSRLPKSLLELVIQGVFPITRAQWNDFVTRTAPQIYNNTFVRVTPYIAGSLCAIFLARLYFFQKENYWNMLDFSNKTTVAGWLLLVNVFFLYFLIALAVLRIIATSFVLITFFRFAPAVQPLHPDACGGLSPLGKLSTSLNLGAFLYGFLSAIGIYANHYNYGYEIYSGVNVLIMTVYVLGASVIFFFPLLAAHNCMKDAKYNTIQVINYRFEQVNQELIETLNKTGKPNKKEIENLESLQKMYEIAKRMPVYPFNIETVSSFAGSTLTPVGIYILQIIISKNMGV